MVNSSQGGGPRIPGFSKSPPPPLACSRRTADSLYSTGPLPRSAPGFLARVLDAPCAVARFSTYGEGAAGGVGQRGGLGRQRRRLLGDSGRGSTNLGRSGILAFAPRNRLDPRLPAHRARTNARLRPDGVDRRDLGGHQRGVAERRRADSAPGDRTPTATFPGVGQARCRCSSRLRPSHDATQRRLWSCGWARPRAGRRRRPPARRQYHLLLPRERAWSAAPQLFRVDHALAGGVRADRLPLGLPRGLEPLAGRRSARC